MNREDNHKRLEELRKLPIKRTTWEEIEAFVDYLPSNYNGVYGIPRAGGLLAIIYSYRKNLPLLNAPQEGCIVIDDDIGTGLTILGYVGKYDVAVMFSNRECEIVPKYVWKYYDDENVFRIFPWEIDYESSN